MTSAGHLSGDLVDAIYSNNGDPNQLVMEWGNYDSADIDEDLSVWVHGAGNGRWLSPEDLRNFVAWLTMQGPMSVHQCDGCGRSSGTWEYPEGPTVTEDNMARTPMLCGVCLRNQSPDQWR